MLFRAENLLRFFLVAKEYFRGGVDLFQFFQFGANLECSGLECKLDAVFFRIAGDIALEAVCPFGERCEVEPLWSFRKFGERAFKQLMFDEYRAFRFVLKN